MVAKPVILPGAYPFDYDKDRVISYSEINEYRKCPLSHHIFYVERWKKPVDDDSALFKGTLYHLVMEAHFNVLKAWQDENPRKSVYPPEMREQCRIAAYSHLNVGSEGQTETESLVQWMYDGYVEHYGLNPEWRILAVEYQMAEVLPDPRTGEDSPYVIKAKLDLIIQDRLSGKVWVVDQKSGKNLPAYDDLDLNDQFGLYNWLLQMNGVPIVGTIHAAARTQRNQADFPEYSGKSKPQMLEDRFRLTLLSRTDDELKSVAADAWAVAVNMYPEDAGFQPLPIYSSPMPNVFGYNREFKEAYLLARKGNDLRKTMQVMGYEQDHTRH